MRILILVLTAAMLFVSCGKKPDDLTPSEISLQKGLKLFERKKYGMAADEFENAIKRAEDPELAGTAQIFLADSYFLDKEYEMAIPAYETYIRIYPESENAPRAMLRLGLCYYRQIDSIDRDKKNIEEAMVAFQELREAYPGYGLEYELGDKIRELRDMLAERELYVAEFYFRIDEERAAIRRLHFLVKNYPDTTSYPEALYLLGDFYAGKKGYEAEAIKYFRELVTEAPESKRFSDVPKRLSVLLSRITEDIEERGDK